MAWPKIDGRYTVDGMHLRAYRVQRVLILTYATARQAERVAQDLVLLDCEVDLDGRRVRVAGVHDVLAEIESMLT